jgi:hypothetical protein
MYKLVLLIISFFLLTGCTAMRSARGLDKGDIQISYNAPYGGDLRIGITDYIEGRYALNSVELNQIDVFIHTHFDQTAFNYGMSTGFFEGHIDYRAMFINGIISKGINNSILPYLGISYSVEFGWYLHTGAEITLFKLQSYQIQLTPEIMVNRDILNDRYSEFDIVGVLGIGVRFNLFKQN